MFDIFNQTYRWPWNAKNVISMMPMTQLHPYLLQVFGCQRKPAFSFGLKKRKSPWTTVYNHYRLD